MSVCPLRYRPTRESHNNKAKLNYFPLDYCRETSAPYQQHGSFSGNLTAPLCQYISVNSVCLIHVLVNSFHRLYHRPSRCYFTQGNSKVTLERGWEMAGSSQLPLQTLLHCSPPFTISSTCLWQLSTSLDHSPPSRHCLAPCHFIMDRVACKLLLSPLVLGPPLISPRSIPLFVCYSFLSPSPFSLSDSIYEWKMQTLNSSNDWSQSGGTHGGERSRMLQHVLGQNAEWVLWSLRVLRRLVIESWESFSA